MNPQFHPTRWTLVSRASGGDQEAKNALSELCESYYQPVVNFLTRQGHDSDQARDLTHDFFAEVLTKGVGSPDQNLGRFRTYLLASLKNFLSKKRDSHRTQKRGGEIEHVPLSTETSPGNAQATTPAPDDSTYCFDREWTFLIISRTLNNLEAEHQKKPHHFTTLKPWLNGSPSTSQAQAAADLEMSETAVKVAIHRLRQRFREILRQEIAQTVSNEADINDELSYLIRIASEA